VQPQTKEKTLSYVESNLTPGEQVIAYGKVHWYVYVPGGVLLALGVVLIMTSGVLGWLLAISGAVLLVKGWIASTSTELAITNKRVIAKFGFIRRSTVELMHSKVEGFNVEQGILGRILDFGTIIVNGTGAGKTPIPQIAAPQQFRKQALAAIESKA
jgi:uncharacterized membrane protein YdbT with pleckstrin-like domain